MFLIVFFLPTLNELIIITMTIIIISKCNIFNFFKFRRLSTLQQFARIPNPFSRIHRILESLQLNTRFSVVKPFRGLGVILYEEN